MKAAVSLTRGFTANRDGIEVELPATRCGPEGGAFEFRHPTFDNYVTPPEIRLGVKPWVLEAPQRKALIGAQ